MKHAIQRVETSADQTKCQQALNAANTRPSLCEKSAPLLVPRRSGVTTSTVCMRTSSPLP